MISKQIRNESLGMNANIGIGYRRLSKGEHAYVGVNAVSMTMCLKVVISALVAV